MSRFKPFKHYRDTGVWWMGAVPAHWRCAKIKRFAALRSGHTPSRSKPEYWVDCTIPWFSLADVWQLRDERNIFLGDTKEKISKLGLANSAADLLPAGTVVLSRTASVGFSGIMPRPMATTQDFVNWVPGPELSSKYLLYVLRSMGPVFESLKAGSTHKTIYVPDVLGFSTPLPPPEEQNRIARFLDYETAKIDALIDKQRQLIALLNEKRQAVISHAVTKGLNPDAPLRDSGIEWLGKIPAHWRTSRVKFVVSHVVDCHHSTPRYDPDAPYPALRTADISPGRIDVAGARRVDAREYAGRTARLKPIAGDIIYSREGERWGMAGPVPANVELCMAQRVMLFRANTTMSPPFLMWALNSFSVYHQLAVDLVGATSPHVNIGDIKNAWLAIPPVDEQDGIATYLASRLHKLDSLDCQCAKTIEVLRERRAALISAAVTGKIDVRNWKAPDMAPEAAAAAETEVA